MTILEPLSGFGYSIGLEINTRGDVIGNSNEGGGGLPLARATLWTGGVASEISASRNRSDALKINDRGDILYVEYAHPSSEFEPRYLLKSDGSITELNRTVPDLVFPIDLSDTRRLLCAVRTPSGETDFVVHDLNTGTRIIVPKPTPLGGQYNWTLYGMDNIGRVLGGFSRYGGHQRKNDLMWLPAGGATWNAVGLSTTNLLPTITKDGFVLATFDDGAAGVLDLRAAAPVLQRLPVYRSRSWGPYLNLAFGANARGYVVGSDSWSVATLYDPVAGTNDSVAGLFPADFDPFYARAINEAGIAIGYGIQWTGPPGTPGRTGRNRGWLNQLVGGAASMPLRPIDVVGRILFGIIQDGGGVIFIPGRGPIPIPPWTPRLSPERMDVLTGLAVSHISDAFADPELRALAARLANELLEKGVTGLRES